ncbi:Permease [Klebsiella pneumoniae]|uniref:Permease n=1 Tax=Klebsiella pneumoniae TaxID=573 RepID=A0A2X3GWB8_KLEPN|nr:Permease [Klebsiella pneumoniae]
MLAQRSELVVMQASGFTRLQVALAVMKTAIPLVLLTMAIGEWVAPQGEQMARNYRATADVRRLAALNPAGAVGERCHNFVYIERVKATMSWGASASMPSTRSVVYSRCAYAASGKIR